MSTLPLDQYQPVTLDGSGNGTARLGPRNLRETWQPAIASVSVSTQTAEALCRIYEGESADQPNFIDGTVSGSTGDSTGHLWGPLICGQYVWAVWTAGDPGAQAVLRVRGTKEIA